MKKIIAAAMCAAITGCSSIPLPAGWESQSTKNTKEQNELVLKLARIAEDSQAEPAAHPCASIQRPESDESDNTAAYNAYYLSVVACMAIAGNARQQASPATVAIKEIEKTRRAELDKKSKMGQLWMNGLGGFFGTAADVYISSEDRKSREKIAGWKHQRDLKELEYPDEGSIWVTGGGVYNQDSHNDSSDNSAPVTEDNDIANTDSYNTDSQNTPTTTEDHDITNTDSNNVDSQNTYADETDEEDGG